MFLLFKFRTQRYQVKVNGPNVKFFELKFKHFPKVESQKLFKIVKKKLIHKFDTGKKFD